MSDVLNVLTGEPIKWAGLEGFDLVGKPRTKRIVASVWGAQKTGKTTLALTFPKPIVDLNLDFGIEELLLTRPELFGDVFKKDLEMNELTDPGTWGNLLTEFHENYIKALENLNRYGGTVVVDTATQLWSIVQAVKVDQVREERIEAARKRAANKNQKEAEEIIARAEKPSRMDYGEANGFMGGILRRALHFPNVSAVFIHRAKPKFNDRGAMIEGSWEFHGFGETSAITQVHLYMYKKSEAGVPGGVHHAQIEHCRFNSAYDGLTIRQPTFEILQGMIYPADDSTPDEE